MVQARTSVRRSLGTIAMVVAAAAVLAGCSGAVLAGDTAESAMPTVSVAGVTATTPSTTQPWIDRDGRLHVPVDYAPWSSSMPAKERESRSLVVRQYLKALKGMDVDDAVALVRADGWATQIVNDGGIHMANAVSRRVSFFQDSQGRVKYANPV